jgi:2-methylcitrate dehydratase
VRPFIPHIDEIQINIRVSRNAIRTMASGPESWRPETHETADHSMPYSVGLVLMFGTVEDHYYEDPYLHDQRLLDLISRVHVFHSEEADLHEREYNLCDLEVVLKSGQRKAVRVDYHRGHSPSWRRSSDCWRSGICPRQGSMPCWRNYGRSKACRMWELWWR